MRKLERELRREFPFARVETTGSNHYRLRLPNGRTVIVSNTPGCREFLRHVRNDVRRKMESQGGRP